MTSKIGYNLKSSKEPEAPSEPAPDRIEQLETRITQLETILKNTVTFDTLVARLVGTPDTKKVRKQRSKRELTPEEKAAFHARMVAAKLAKEKSRNASKK